MNKRQLLAHLQRLDVRPSRKLGQNFLVDPNTLEAIVRTAAPQPGELIVEIGPGTGVMTEALLAAGAEIVAIEYDVRLAADLAERFGHRPGFICHTADAARADFDALTDERPYRVVANLPYAASTPILGRLLEARQRPLGMCLLLQLELAERLAARSGSKVYGSLSVRIQSVYDVTLERRVAPEVFVPRPAVASALVTLTERSPPMSPAAYNALAKVVGVAFSQRRKQLAKRLAAHWDTQTVEYCFAELGIPPTARPEDVSPEQFRLLAQELT